VEPDLPGSHLRHDGLDEFQASVLGMVTVAADTLVGGMKIPVADVGEHLFVHNLFPSILSKPSVASFDAIYISAAAAYADRTPILQGDTSLGYLIDIEAAPFAQFSL
jgi:hypothetical protein